MTDVYWMFLFLLVVSEYKDKVTLTSLELIVAKSYLWQKKKMFIWVKDICLSHKGKNLVEKNYNKETSTMCVMFPDNDKDATAIRI